VELAETHDTDRLISSFSDVLGQVAVRF